jgi:hypothetical protein
LVYLTQDLTAITVQFTGGNNIGNKLFTGANDTGNKVITDGNDTVD